jgi:magnesium transporter
VPEGNWKDLLDPDAEEIRTAVSVDLHPRALAQLLDPPKHDDQPRPALETHGEYVFGVFLVPIIVSDEDRVFVQEVDLILTRDTALTIRKTPDTGDPPFEIDGIEKTCALEKHLEPGMIAYYVVDEVAERFLDLIDALNEEIDELEDQIEEWPTQRVRGRISELRHDTLKIRRVLQPTRDAIRHVVDDRIDLDDGGLFPRDVELHFGDGYDKLLRAVDGLDLSRDLIAGVRDYHQSKIANDQNEVMKKLTVIASLLLLPTFIVGVYGQNFRHHFPELAWRFGYLWSWFLIAATTAGQLWFFRRKRWI